MLPLVAFTKVVPAEDAVNVTVAFPFTSVIPDDKEMLPTVALLTVHVTLIPEIGSEPLSAVAVNAHVPAILRLATDGETTSEVRTGDTDEVMVNVLVSV